MQDSIRRTQNGEPQAFQVIVEKYKYSLFVWVTRFLGTADPVDAEDIVQEIFLSAYTHIQSYDPAKAGICTWLFGIAKNLCLNELRKQRPEPRADFDEVSSPNDPALTLQQREIHHKLDQALNNLSPEHRSVFILYDLLGFSHREISVIEKICIGTVKSRLSRARKELRKNLNQYWRQYEEKA